MSNKKMDIVLEGLKENKVNEGINFAKYYGFALVRDLGDVKTGELFYCSDMDKNTESVRNASQKMADSSQHVLDEMNDLHSSVDAVGDSIVSISGNSQKVVSSGMRLDNCVESLNQNVNKLGDDVGQFKTEADYEFE